MGLQHERVTVRHAIGDLCPSPSPRADSASRQRDASLVLHCAHRPPCFPKLGSDDFLPPFLMHLCTVQFSAKPSWFGTSGAFFGSRTCQTLPPFSPWDGLSSGQIALDKIHDHSQLFTPTHLHGKISHPTVLQGFAQWCIWRSSARGQWPRQCQHRPRDALCARICNACRCQPIRPR